MTQNQPNQRNCSINKLDSGNNLRKLGEVIEDTGRPIKAKHKENKEAKAVVKFLKLEQHRWNTKTINMWLHVDICSVQSGPKNLNT